MSHANYQTLPDENEDVQLIQSPKNTNNKTQTLRLIGRTALGVIGFITLVTGMVFSAITPLFVLLAFAGIAALLTSGFLFLNNSLKPKEQPSFALKIKTQKPITTVTSKSTPSVSPNTSPAFFEKPSIDTTTTTKIDPPRPE
jgi:hypothetical protein